MSTLLGRRPPQMRAASWKTMRRWAPIVVPVLPPTGVAGVASLKPTPAPSVTTTTRFAAGAGRAARQRTKKKAAARTNETRRIVGFLGLFRAGRGGGLRGRDRLCGGVRAVDAALPDRTVRGFRGHRVAHRVFTELDHLRSVR